jgi:hypothetical protein
MEPVETAFLPLPAGIVLESVHPTQTAVVVQIACKHKSAACPQCERLSERVHGHYTRTVADLPCGGRRILLRFVVRKFVCSTPTCPQQIFTERRSELVQSYARMTNRLRDATFGPGDDHRRGEWRAAGAQAGNARVCPDAPAADAEDRAASSRSCTLAWHR